MHSNKQSKGFAVLTSTLLLSLAGIAFTTNLASTQLIDNQVMGNYYRNHQAFVNAESGISLILSKIDESDNILASLPLIYQPTASDYRVQLERINKNTVAISSVGRSADGSAEREIKLQVYHEVSYNIPKSALAANGKLNINSTTTINEGCEGVDFANCKSPGNIANYQLISQPSNETQISECTGATLGQNQIDQGALYTASEDNYFLLIGEEKSVVDESGNTVTETPDWPYTQPLGSEFHGIAAADSLSPSSLFESTFGVTRDAGVNALQSSFDVATIDMTLGSKTSCSTRLQALTQHDTIYIKGDCDIDQSDTSKSVTSEKKHFTIGTIDNPKLVFIEGGTFITKPDMSVSLIGMLYFLPGKQLIADENGNHLEIEDHSVNMGGIRVNGALLSDYNCSTDGYDKTGNSAVKQHLSVRYDKAVLNQLYKNTNSVAVDSGYSLVAGSWRDF